MKRNFVFLVAIAFTMMGSSASACCMFPFFSGGYPMYGMAPPVFPGQGYYSAGYAPSYYSGAANSGCCAPSYSVGYSGYSSSGCCGCSTGCCGTGGCGVAGCGTSDCVGTEIRNRPEPDTDVPKDHKKRTYGDEGYEDDPLKNDPLKKDPMGDDSFGRSGRGSDQDGDADWMGRRKKEEDDLIPGFDRDPYKNFEDKRKPGIGDDSGVGAGDEVLEHGARKPPMSAPVHEETPDDDEDRDPSDVLPKSDESPSKTTALRDGRSFVRFAGFSGKGRSVPTRLSTVKTKHRAPRWISVPAPVGRVRL